MPELPEVEIIRMGLEKYLVGKTIENVEVRLPKIIKAGNVQDLVGGRVIKIRRFGKALVIDLDNGKSIVSHVKLTGQFIYAGLDRPEDSRVSEELVGKLPGRFTHVIFKVKSREAGFLYYNDMRQFGWIRILPTQEVEELPFIKELGPEPIRLAGVVRLSSPSKSRSRQAPLTLDNFRQILEGKKTAIKVLLMDQKKISGVGNIYANDALFLAHVNPKRPGNSLSSKERLRLYEAVGEVLKRGFRYGGATEANYVNVLGEPGGYQKHFLVYGKESKPCPECGGKIVRSRIGGRGTYFCPRCQK